ncbi:methyltransferase domain-containing protein [Patescibacteria group bacterium]|nr:methyltransferase domain-containing protein [Patescibacteria group bacterium]
MKKNARHFWDKEYKTGSHLTLSDAPSEDLVKFTRWLIRQSGREFLNPTVSVLDLGCGNGRNLIYLAEQFGLRGVGYDSSHEAVATAKRRSGNLPITYEVRSVGKSLPLPDKSQTLVLDMMTSHFLSAKERELLGNEISRLLKPGGWLFWKTFLRDGDRHAERLLREYPTDESGSYIHPEFGATEHVFTEEEARTALNNRFIIHKITKSHNPDKRRSMSLYAKKAG